MALPSSAALPAGLYSADRGQGQVEIMPVKLSRAERWVDDLYLGDAFRPIIVVKQRRTAMVNGKQKIHQQSHETPVARKRKRKATDHEIEIKEAIYWAPVDIDVATTTKSFIDAMAIESEKRSQEEDRIIDNYWAEGMSLDPVLKTETISETHAYLKLDEKVWKTKDYLDRGIEDGDLDSIDDSDDALTARATKYRKIASTASIHTSTT